MAMITGKRFQRELAYLFSKINWKDSCLDARAISIMNEMPGEVSESLDLLENKFNEALDWTDDEESARRQADDDTLTTAQRVVKNREEGF